MANTEKRASNTITLSDIDEDYTFPDYLELTDIQFLPGAADDKAVFYDAGEQPTENDQPDKLTLESDDGLPRVKYYYDGRLLLRLDFSDSTITAGSKIIISFRYFSWKNFQPLG